MILPHSLKSIAFSCRNDYLWCLWGCVALPCTHPCAKVQPCSPLLSRHPSLLLSTVLMPFLHIFCCSAIYFLLCTYLLHWMQRVEQKEVKQTPWRQQGLHYCPMGCMGALRHCSCCWAVLQHPGWQGWGCWVWDVTFTARQSSSLRPEHGLTAATGVAAVILL